MRTTQHIQYMRWPSQLKKDSSIYLSRYGISEIKSNKNAHTNNTNNNSETINLRFISNNMTNRSNRDHKLVKSKDQITDRLNHTETLNYTRAMQSYATKLPQLIMIISDLWNSVIRYYTEVQTSYPNSVGNSKATE